MRVRRREDAEDLTHLVFERIFGALPRFQHNGRPFAAWAFRIARNAVIDHQRRLRPTEQLGSIAEPSDGDSDSRRSSLRGEEIRELQAAIRQLTPDQQEAIALRYAVGLSAEEAARVMGRRAGTIRGLTFRAIESLRRHLVGGGATDEPVQSRAPAAADPVRPGHRAVSRGDAERRSSPTRSSGAASAPLRVNQFVAAREGIASPGRTGIARRQMGRVGRACLYASFTLGVSAASVMAASQEALPGDLLYPLKQHIEELRWSVVPVQLHEELAAYALGERIEEMARLAETGHLDLAIAMAPAVDREYDRLVALDQNHDAASAARIERHLLVLEGLLDKLPLTARAAVEAVIEKTPTIGQGTDRAFEPGQCRGSHPCCRRRPRWGPGPTAQAARSDPEADPTQA